MAPVKIHGSPLSTCTQAIMVVAKEIGVQYEIVPVNFAIAEHKSPEFLRLQPFGQVPVLVEEDGFKLFESRAISRYLIAKYGAESNLIPKGLKENATFEQAASIETSNFYPYASGLSAEKVFKPMRGVKGDDARAEEYSNTLEEKLKGYEAILSKQKYLAGNTLTLADLLHLPYGTLITARLGFKGFEKYPSVAAWWNDISSRATWKEVQGEAQAALAALSK